MELKGKTALVTGGTHRIGSAIVKALSEKGTKVAVHSRQPAKDSFQADLNRTTAVKKMVADVEEKFGPIQILINNAAIFERTPFLEITEEDWDRHLNINLKAPFLLSQAVAKGMLEQKEGRIINIADYTAVKPSKDYLPYTISKAGLVSLTKALALELAPHVLVNALSLGPILPPPDYSEEKIKAAANKTLLKRWGDVEEVAKMVLFLLETCDFATGSVFSLDGGRLLV